MAKQRAESREGMIVTTIALDRELHRRIAIAALDANKASAQLIRDAIEDYLDRHERKTTGRRS
jgi:predicted transcriptional regulator